MTGKTNNGGKRVRELPAGPFNATGLQRGPTGAVISVPNLQLYHSFFLCTYSTNGLHGWCAIGLVLQDCNAVKFNFTNNTVTLPPVRTQDESRYNLFMLP